MIKRIILELDVGKDRFKEGESILDYTHRKVKEFGYSGSIILDIDVHIPIHRIYSGGGTDGRHRG